MFKKEGISEAINGVMERAETGCLRLSDTVDGATEASHWLWRQSIDWPNTPRPGEWPQGW